MGSRAPRHTSSDGPGADRGTHSSPRSALAGGTPWRFRLRAVLDDDHRRRVLHVILVVVAALAATIWQATARGQDFNWDQQNYHIGIPFLLAHHTFWKSIAPAGIQSYFNPYVLEAQFYLLRHLPPIAFVVVLAVVQSLAFMIAGLVSAEIARPVGGRQATWLGLIGFALCLIAPMPLSEAGTTFIDLTTAGLVVAAYALLLTRGRVLGPFAAAALAGALLGAATALKLTNAAFAFGVIGFALAGPERPGRRIAWLAVAGVAAACAFAAIGGRWQLGLWERFGDPFFPYYTDIFHVAGFPAHAGRDARWLPRSVLAIWHYPLYWLTGRSPRPGIGSPSAEMRFIDIRWIVAVGSITIFLAALPFSRLWRRERLADPRTGLIFAFTIAYLVWLFEFGYQRYAASIDILCGAVLLALAMQLRRPSWRLPLLLAMAVLSWATMTVPNWGHLPWRPTWQGINAKPLDFAGPSIVFLTVKPSLFIAASLPANARYVGIDGEFDLRAGNDTTLTRQLRHALASAPKAQLKAVAPGAIPAVSAAILASYGLVVTDRCEPLRVADRNFRICDVERRP